MIDNNIYIPDEISALEANLLNNEALSPYDKASIKEDLNEFKHIWDLWLQFGDVPMDPETECIELARISGGYAQGRYLALV